MQDGLSTYDFECFCWRRLFQRKQAWFLRLCRARYREPGKTGVFRK
jgi:hypothetical protein